MIELPILPKIGVYSPIGKVIIDKSKLPDTPDFCLAIGFHRTEDGFDYIPKCFIVVNDLEYTRAMLTVNGPANEFLLNIMAKK
jgi:hypothetical protein